MLALGKAWGVQVAKRYICPVCAGSYGGTTVLCKECKTTHHCHCYEYAGGCAILGCPSRQWSKPSVSEQPAYEKISERYCEACGHLQKVVALLALALYIFVFFLVMSPFACYFKVSYHTIASVHFFDVLAIVSIPLLLALVLYRHHFNGINEASCEIAHFLKAPITRPSPRGIKNDMITSFDLHFSAKILEYVALSTQGVCIAAVLIQLIIRELVFSPIPVVGAFVGFFLISYVRKSVSNIYVFPKSVANRMIASFNPPDEEELYLNKCDYKDTMGSTHPIVEHNAKKKREALGLLILLGAIITFLAYQQMLISQKARADATEMRLEDVETGKQVDNLHIKIGEHFAMYPTAIISYERTGRAHQKYLEEHTRLEDVHYPILSNSHPFIQKLIYLSDKYGDLDKVPDGLIGRPENFSVLVKTKRIKRARDMPDCVLIENNLRGVIVNPIKGPSRKTKRLFKERYPKVDFDKVLLLEEGRKPWPLMLCYACLLVGICLISFCLKELLMDLLPI